MLAGVFHFSPTELMAMTAEDLAFWGDRAQWWLKRLAQQ
jgi:hypothetical protein